MWGQAHRNEDSQSSAGKVQDGSGYHSVDRMGADDGEVRHADHLRVAFLDDAHPSLLLHVAREHALDLAQEPIVDFVYDLQVPAGGTDQRRGQQR